MHVPASFSPLAPFQLYSPMYYTYVAQVQREPYGLYSLGPISWNGASHDLMMAQVGNLKLEPFRRIIDSVVTLLRAGGPQ